jgi:DNA polymerase I-like protein with 3'-5' exonuclease and polymerase domains
MRTFTDNALIIDIESDNLRVKYDVNERVYLVGILNYTTGEYHKFTDMTELRNFLAGVDSLLVFHNAAFDVPSLRLRGIPINNYYCTMVGSHTLNPESSEYHSLGSLQPEVKRSLRDILVEYGYDMTKVPKGDEYTWYGRDPQIDTLVEYYLRKDLGATAKEYTRQQLEYSNLPLLNKVLWTINIPYIERVISMEEGTRITYDTTIPDVLSEAADRSMKAIVSIAGYIRNPDILVGGRVPFPNAGYKTHGNSCKLEMFNPNSNQQVATKLKELYQWEPTLMTKGGQPSTSSEVLEALDYPLCEHLLEYSKATKLVSFCGALRDCGGWIRPSYNQCATRTTRLSSSNPNIQQIPARDKVGKQLRKMFTARDGYTLLVGDQSGFQLRIVAGYMSYYFGDGRLAECFNNGEDVHQFFADIYGIDRKVAKNVTFGWLFGAGVNKMTATANRGNPNPITTSVIRKALDSLVERMPAMPGVKELFIEYAHKNGGVVHDWLGTRYVIPELLSKDKGTRASGERKVCNYVVQGFEASWFRHLQNKAASIVEQYGGRQAFAVHDEVGYEVPHEVADELIPLLNSCMSPSFAEYAPEIDEVHGLRLECEFHKGDNWLDAKG